MVQRPPGIPLDQHVCDLNMDMVGRVDETHPDDDRYIYLIGSDKLSSELHEISEAVNAEHIGIALDYTFNAPMTPTAFTGATTTTSRSTTSR